MKTIFTIIALPITSTISMICFLFVLIFQSDFKEVNGESAFTRMARDSKNLLLMEAWSGIPEIGRAIVSILVYYILFF